MDMEYLDDLDDAFIQIKKNWGIRRIWMIWKIPGSRLEDLGGFRRLWKVLGGSGRL